MSNDDFFLPVMAAGGKSNSCGSCNNNILKKHLALFCSGICVNWFHIDCVNISKEDYDSIKSVLNLSGVKWFCQACVQLQPSQSTCSIHDRFEKLFDIVKGLVSDNLLINEKLDKVIKETSLVVGLSSVGHNLSHNEHSLIKPIDPSPVSKTVPELGPGNKTSIGTDTSNSNPSFSSVVKSSTQVSKNLTSSSRPKPIDSNASTTSIINTVKARANRKRKSTFLTGTSKANTITLSTVQRSKFLFLSRLDPSVSDSDVESYIKSSCEGIFSVEKLKAKHPTYSSFKVGVPGHLWDKLFTEDFWPAGALVGRFFMPKSRPNLNGKPPNLDSGS